jgi:S1-C subfamily serine protease
VAANTPAAQSGLRGGDVIVRVNGDEVVLPVALRRAVVEAADNAVALEVVRKKRRQVVRLAW